MSCARECVARNSIPKSRKPIGVECLTLSWTVLLSELKPVLQMFDPVRSNAQLAIKPEEQEGIYWRMVSTDSIASVSDSDGQAWAF
jgi:hypothetical protein